jgi:hypothetical protein
VTAEQFGDWIRIAASTRHRLDALERRGNSFPVSELRCTSTAALCSVHRLNTPLPGLSAEAHKAKVDGERIAMRSMAGLSAEALAKAGAKR